MPGRTSSAATTGVRARSRRSSGRRTSPSVRTARCMSATGSTRASAATRISTTRCRARSTGSLRRVSCRRSPAFDAATIDGLITALRSPAVNVRAIGFEGLKARGASAVNAVAALLNDPNPYMRGRAIYLLYQLGPEGRQRAGAPESHTDPALRIAAYRAMRRAGSTSCRWRRARARRRPGVRREVALSLRDQPAASARHPGRHRARLRRTGSQLPRSAGHRRDGKEPALYDRLKRELGVPTIRSRGRRHVHADRVAAARAGGGAGPHGACASSKLSLADRRFALDTLAFVNDPAASKAMLTLASRTARCASRRRGGC
jgi:hypothetical protein